MRILFVAPYVPSPIRVRPYQIIRALAGDGHAIHLVALRPPEDRWAPLDALRETCEAVDVFPMSRQRTLWNGLAALPGRRPLQAAYSHHPALEAHVGRLAEAGGWDALHVEHLRGSLLARRARGWLPRVFDAVDSITLLFEQAARQAPSLGQRAMAAADLRRTRRFESRVPYEFERTLVTSPLDRDALLRLAGPDAGTRIVVAPNGVDTNYFRPASSARPDAPTVLFSGKLSYHANTSAALYLAREVLPLVWATRPDVRLTLVGKGPPPAVMALSANPRIEVTGYVDDIRPWFDRATVAAAPLRYGVGIQNKILEAMAAGVPVVTTPCAARSLAAVDERDFLVGESAEDLARRIVRVIDDAPLHTRLSAAGRRYVEQHHDWRETGRLISTVYEEARAAWNDRAGARGGHRPRNG